jgi:hypothetical protein
LNEGQDTLSFFLNKQLIKQQVKRIDFLKIALAAATIFSAVAQERLQADSVPIVHYISNLQ